MVSLCLRSRRAIALCGGVGIASMCAGLGSSASAGVVVDGTLDPFYGSALAVQTVETQFGDNNSELNAGYARIAGGMLYIMITGNIQDNFNNIEIFLDSKANGQGVFDSAGNNFTSSMNGLVFDAGFTADYHLHARRGTAGDAEFNLDFADLAAQTFSSYIDIMGGIQGSGMTGTGVNGTPISVGYNDNNLAGVLGGTDPANQAAALAVTTGFEMAISLADIGYAGGPINIMVGVNNGDHNFWSNQFLGGLPTGMMNGIPMGTGNLGGDGEGGFTGEGAIDFNTIAGNQYFTLVPAPGALALLLIGAVRSRRSRRST